MDVSRAEGVTVHHREEFSRTKVVRDRVGCGLEADGSVSPRLVRLEPSATVILGFLRRLTVVEAVGGLAIRMLDELRCPLPMNKTNSRRAKCRRWRP